MQATKKGVHLYLDCILVAERWTHRDRPAQWYEVHGVIYDVLSYLAMHDADGGPGFDVQVRARI